MRTVVRLGLGALVALSGVGAAHAGFTPYIIRDGATPTVWQTNNSYTPGAVEFIIDQGGKKGGLGSNDINGAAIGDILNLSITRWDDPTRFAGGSGAFVAPYFNIWVTDGTNYAVIANEPSNPAFQSLFEYDSVSDSWSYNLSFADLASHPVQVYETPNGGYGSTTTWVHDALNLHTQLTFADIAGLIIGPPPVSYFTPSDPAGVGSGAPNELGTNVAYGFNWIFGDTLANYVSGQDGYIVSNASASAVVPIPGAAGLGMLGMGLVSLLRRRKNIAA